MDSAPTVRWNLRDGAGAMVPNGAYTFKLTAPPADGIGDVVGLKPSGVISYIPGNGKGAFGTTMSASGWPSTVATRRRRPTRLLELALLACYLDSTWPSGSGPAASSSRAVRQAGSPGYSSVRR
ncbi:hypothetical protein [Streptomyces sp. GQFP]|uniref:hypothetical protein n=1 Tax=Streptomyces sp. GQFP TaxID=2907545 RepID=UPI001F409DB7|nr:hypothetical protein [Streptomyces sp. GQFP]UIX31927.1 hypothetical protein LUX31_18855 [Streptomyces sp. GQFP]